MAIYVAKNGQLQTVKGIYYGMTEDYINATRFHNLVPKTATEIKFLYASDNPDLTGYQRIGYADTKNFIEVWKSGTKYILINPKKNYIYSPTGLYDFLNNYSVLVEGVFNNFDTRYATNMLGMFNGCSKLTSLYLNLNTQRVSDMQYMFFNCKKLTTIISNTFDITSNPASRDMFWNCFSLVGGNGTTYNGSHATAEYARVDGENGLAGYFTAPN